MKKFVRRILLFGCSALVFCSCTNPDEISEKQIDQSAPEFYYQKWTVSEPILEKGPLGAFDELSVKDPTIVFYNNKYHLFYTSKATYETRNRMPHLSKNGSGLGYIAAESLELLKEATRYDLGKITESVIVAPQVFYFEPQKLWYIIAQTIVEGRPDLMPIYLTNPDIENIHGWSKFRIIETKKMNDGFWIDFWVICDNDRQAGLLGDQLPTGENRNIRKHGFLTIPKTRCFDHQNIKSTPQFVNYQSCQSLPINIIGNNNQILGNFN